MAGRTTVEILSAKIDAQSARIADLAEQLRRERSMLWALIAILGAAVGGGLVALMNEVLK